jgi:hypothetical protein
MPLKFTTRCSGERHSFSIDNKGVMHIDETLHDLALEQTLADLGAEPPMCITIYERWRNNPFYFIQEHVGQKFVRTRDHQTGLILGLGVDFAYRVTALMNVVDGCATRNQLKYAHEVVLHALKLAKPEASVRDAHRIQKDLLTSSSDLNKQAMRFTDKSDAQMLAAEAAQEAIIGIVSWDTNGADNARIQAVAAMAAAAVGPDYVSQDVVRFDLQARMQRPPIKAVVDLEEAWQRKRAAYVLRYYRKHKVYPDLPKLPRFKS